MAIYSVNQVRHLYVVHSVEGDVSNDHKLTEEDEVGTVRPVTDKDKTHVYFEYRGPGGLMRSDLIPVDNIMSVTFTEHGKMQRHLVATKVTLSPEVNGGEPVAGQDYILNINIRQYIGMSDRNQTLKYGAVRAFKGMDASKFYVKLAQSLALNFSREIYPLLKFYVTEGEDKTEVTPRTKVEDLTGTYDSVYIEEVEQEWVLGIKSQEPVYYDVYFNTIRLDGEEVVWGETTKEEGAVIENGKEIADLEYFCLGDRGDVYRNIGWPNSIPTKYVADSTTAYDVFNIHYYYEGDNENPQKSEKDMTFAIGDPGTKLPESLSNNFVDAVRNLGIDNLSKF